MALFIVSLSLLTMLFTLWTVYALRELMESVKAQQLQLSTHWDRLNTLAEQVQDGQRYSIAHIPTPCAGCSGTGLKRHAQSEWYAGCDECNGLGSVRAVTANPAGCDGGRGGNDPPGREG